MKFLRHGHVSVKWRDKILFFGGAHRIESQVMCYDTLTNECRPILTKTKTGRKPSCLNQLKESSATVCGDKLYIFGGYNSDAVWDEFWELDLVKKSWKKLPSTTFRKQKLKVWHT